MITENSLVQAFLPIINAGLIANSFLGVVVQSAYQPTQQGIPTAPTVYFHKTHTKRYGFLGRLDVWDGFGSRFDHSETQVYETGFRIQAAVLQYPVLPTYTASDLAEEVSSIMQSDATRYALNAQDIGILRITDIQNPAFENDADNYQFLPAFDFILTYSNTRVTETPKLDTIQSGIYRV